ncbi:MAG: high-potential iron-sulfur protein, partial [Pseudomonadota bacterium]|nr:high-potential iron-sulfur protein [Pseudomonadota bacterium]
RAAPDLVSGSKFMYTEYCRQLTGTGESATMGKLISRRKLLDHGMRLSLAGVLIGATRAASATEKVCADPQSLDSGAQSMRASLNYVDVSPDAGKTCAKCAFFEASGDGCGMCQLLHSPVNAKGHCEGFGAET